MECLRCQHENRAQAKFCEECGSPLARTCRRCRAELSAAARFCSECGQPVATTPAGESRFASPQWYTPRHLAEKILTSRAALEGERKQVTVLFADLKGSMELLIDRDPEEARKLLDPVLDRMMEAVHRYEGTVNQVMGDGIMALFGAPVAHEDHAVRACYAALDMQIAIRRYAEEVRRLHGVNVQIRVGLNSGEVVVRAIGSDLHMDYTAVGQTTHLAARMEQLATAGTTLVTAETLRLAAESVDVKRVGPVPVKGLDTPVEVYELVGAGPRQSRFHAAAARGLTSFVGRERELGQLRQAMGRAAAGHGQVVGIAGEPGVGKSRLLWEVTHAHHSHGWLVVQASAVSYGKATPYLPVIDLLRGYLQIEDHDDPGRIREKLARRLVALDLAPGSLVPALPALLDVPTEDPAWSALDPLQRRQQTLDAAQRLLIRESERQPLLVLFEDLQWIDAETQAFLDGLVEGLPTARILLLVAYRPEYEHGWSTRSYYSQIEIEPLAPETAEELLRALLGRDPSLEPLKPRLVERTEGNPFFLEESVRTLVETRVLVGKRGAYRMVQSVPEVQVPSTVQAVLAARIDRLPVAEKRLLQLASVIGREVPFALLRSVDDTSEDELRRGLDELQAGEFLHESRVFPEAQYTFKHALTHDVAYEGLLHQQRRALHARLAQALEALGPDRSIGQVEQLSHHAFRGEMWEKSVAYSRQAGAKAAARGATREAVTYFRQALTALQHLPETRETLEQAIDLRLSLGASFVVLADFAHASECLHEAETLAEGLDDQRRFGRVSALMTQCSWLTGELDRAVESGRRALDIAQTLGDFPLRVRTGLFLGWTYHLRGDYPRATDLLRQTIASLPGELGRRTFGVQVLPAVGAQACLAWCLSELGAFPEAVAIGQEATRLAEGIEHPFNPNLVYARFGTAAPHLHQGNLAQAIPPLERALQVCRRVELSFVFPLVAAHLARAYALAGRVAEAVPLLKQAVERSRVEVKVGLPLWTAWLSECYLSAGSVDEAAQLAGRALALCRVHKERGHEAWILRLLAEITSRRDPPDLEQAQGHYREALALATDLGMRPLVAHCHVGLGTLQGRARNGAERGEHLATGATMYRAMDMGFWLAQAEAALGEGPPATRGGLSRR